MKRGFLPPVAVLVALVAAGCTHSGSSAPSPTGTSGSGATAVPSVAPTSAGLGGSGGEQPVTPRSTIITTPSGKLSTPASAAEVDGSCPYISNADFQQFEGDRVGRVTLLQTKPVGCRFYFAYQSDQIIGEVLVQSFASANTAFNTVALAGQSHPEVQSEAALGDGAVAFRTDLQGEQTWQCVFALGTRVFTVRTRQDSPAQNAFNLAAAVVKTVR